MSTNRCTRGSVEPVGVAVVVRRPPPEQLVPQQRTDPVHVPDVAPGPGGALHPHGLRGAPVLVLAGGVDLQWPPQALAEFAALFPAARFLVQPGAGPYPWLDDAGRFVSTVTAFLNDGP